MKHRPSHVLAACVVHLTDCLVKDMRSTCIAAISDFFCMGDTLRLTERSTRCLPEGNLLSLGRERHMQLTQSAQVFTGASRALSRQPADKL